MSFAKNMGKNLGKNISKKLRGKYSEKFLNHAQKYVTDQIQPKPLQKGNSTNSRSNGNLICNKIVDEITKKSFPKKI